MKTTPEMTQFLASLADPQRLRLVGLLSQGSASAQEIGTTLGMSPAELQAHLAELLRLEVIRKEAEHYLLDESAIDQFRIRQLHQPRQTFSPPPHLEFAEAEIIRKLANLDGSLKSLPIQRKQWLAVLHYILPDFQFGESYNEKQVNSLLKRYHPDTAALRRHLVDENLLQREADGSRYWRVGEHG